MAESALMTEPAQAVEWSFDEVFRRRLPPVLRTAYRVPGNWHDAEDAAQEVFVRLHRHGARFANEAAMDGDLYRVTFNPRMDRARSGRAESQSPAVELDDCFMEAELILEEQRRHLMKTLAKLPVKQRAAVVLREIEGLSTKSPPR